MAVYTIDLRICCDPQNQTILLVGPRAGLTEVVPLAVCEGGEGGEA